MNLPENNIKRMLIEFKRNPALIFFYRFFELQKFLLYK